MLVYLAQILQTASTAILPLIVCNVFKTTMKTGQEDALGVILIAVCAQTVHIALNATTDFT